MPMKPGIWGGIVTAFFFVACGHLNGKAPDIKPDPRTLQIVDNLRQINHELDSFKGIGNVTIWHNGQKTLNQRVAWIGSNPLKFRIELLFSGQSLVKIVSDGQRLTYRDLTSDRYPYGKIQLTESNLERLLSIRMRPEDFMLTLSGRVPVYDHDQVVLIENTNRTGYVLELRKKWRGLVERIFLDPSQQTVQAVELYDRTKRLKYRILYERIKAIDAYRIPERLEVTTDDGNRFQLTIHQYRANVPVRDSMFVLSPPS